MGSREQTLASVKQRRVPFVRAQAPGAFEIPAWLIGVLPVLNYILNEAIIRVAPEMSGDDKRNLVTAVSIALVAGLAIFGAVTLPEPVPTSGLVEDWVPWVIVVLGWAWGGAKAIHDGVDAVGKRASGGAVA